jgi:peroxiredoxin
MPYSFFMNPQNAYVPPSLKPLAPAEGLGALHLFYRIDLTAWRAQSDAERADALAGLENLVETARAQEQTTVVTLSMLARADLGFMILSPDLHELNALEKKLAASLGPDVLVPEFTYLSLTERSDTRERLYPSLPPWEYFCFYPMSKKRVAGQNWYALDHETRRKLMGGHMRVGRTFAGRVRQLVTGSTGTDDWEWGVTLFAHDPADIKAIVYEMRFDEVTHTYGEFGPFFNGLPLPLRDIYRRLLLA